MLLRLYPIRFWQNIGFLCVNRNLERGNASERMGPRGHMTLMGFPSYKSNASTSIIRSLPSGRPSNSTVPTESASQARQRSTNCASHGFFRLNRMQAAPETSKNTIESPSRLDFVREIEMWCSLCLVFGTVNVIHLIIDFAETKSVR
jgi:hypothetical protein